MWRAMGPMGIRLRCMQQQTCIAANLYSSKPGQQVFRPSASVSTATVYLGHIAKNQGEHYVSLKQVTDHNNDSEEEYKENDPGERENFREICK